MQVTKKQTLRGDTLIEVLFSVAIFALVAISVTTLMNSMLGKSQSSIEIVMARSEIDDQAEAIRFIHSSRQNNVMKRVWEKIDSRALSSASPTYNVDKILLKNVDACSDFFDPTKSVIPSHGFYIDNYKLNPTGVNVEYDANAILRTSNLREAVIFPRILHNVSSADVVTNNFDGTSTINAAEGIWVIAVRDKDTAETANFYDFYIQTCWNAVNSSSPTTINTIIRLRNPVKTASTTPVTPIAGGCTTMTSVAFKDWDGGDLGGDSQCPGTTVKQPSDPSRTGYTFIGWSNGYETKFSGITAPTTSDTETWIAQYTENPVACTSSAEFFNGATRLATRSANCGSSVTAPTATRTGYTFTGWSGTPLPPQTPTTSGGTNRYDAQFAVIEYDVSITYKAFWDGHAGDTTETGTISCENTTFTTAHTVYGNVGSVSFTVNGATYTANRSGVWGVPWSARLTIDCSGSSVSFSAGRV